MNSILDEDWRRSLVIPNDLVVRDHHGPTVATFYGASKEECLARMELAMIAGRLAKDLLATEWCAWEDCSDFSQVGGGYCRCPECEGARPPHPEDARFMTEARERHAHTVGHEPDCERGKLCDEIRRIQRESER